MNKNLRILILILTLIFGGIYGSGSASGATKKSSSYKKGWNAVYLTPRQTLDGLGLEKIFNLNGKPVRSRAEAMCNYFLTSTNYYTTATNMKDWYKGCTDALMTLRSNY